MDIKGNVINNHLATSTYSTNQEITMNNVTASIVKPVNAYTLAAKLRRARIESTKVSRYTDNQLATINHEVDALAMLLSIIDKDALHVYDEVDAPTVSNKLIPAVADVVKRDDAATAIDELGWRLAKTAAGGRSWAKVARACGYTVTGADGVVTLSVHFTPGDKDVYLRHSDTMRNLIGRCPVVESGSTWGDDGVATMINEERGSIVLNTSGVSKRFVAGLR